MRKYNIKNIFNPSNHIPVEQKSFMTIQLWSFNLCINTLLYIDFEMNFLAATHSKDLEYCFLFSFLIETFLLQPFCPLCESVHTTEANRIFLITRALEQGKVISVGILNIYNNLICSGGLLLTNASYVENSGDSAQHSLFYYFSPLT